MRTGAKIRTTSKLALAAIAFGFVFLGSAGQSRAGTDPFFGVMSQLPLSDQEFDTMAWGRLGSYRQPVAWDAIEPRADGHMDWSSFDRVVVATASRGIELLPVLYYTPDWLAGDRRRLPIWGKYPIHRWKRFLRAAVLRYGSDGEFWVQHPELPVRPVTEWQIWNEPNIKYFAWPVSPKRYAKLLKISARVIRNFDPDAKVVLAGLYGRVPKGKGLDSGPFLNKAYRIRGFRSSFDIAAIHPYASSTRGSIKRTWPVRKVLNRRGNRGRELLITELGWGSDSATVFGKGTQFRQGVQLTSAYRAILKQRKRLKLGCRLLVRLGRPAQGRQIVRFLPQDRAVQFKRRCQAGLVPVARLHPEPLKAGGRGPGATARRSASVDAGQDLPAQ